MVLKLLEIIVKPNALESCTTGCKLNTIDLKSDGNLLPLDKMNAGFAVLDTAEKLKRTDVVSTTQIKNLINISENLLLQCLKRSLKKVY